jgi:hypothetical protein
MTITTFAARGRSRDCRDKMVGLFQVFLVGPLARTYTVARVHVLSESDSVIDPDTQAFWMGTSTDLSGSYYKGTSIIASCGPVAVF